MNVSELFAADIAALDAYIATVKEAKPVNYFELPAAPPPENTETPNVEKPA